MDNTMPAAPAAQPECSACGAPCESAGDGEWWVCTRCRSEWNADHDPRYAMDEETP